MILVIPEPVGDGAGSRGDQIVPDKVEGSFRPHRLRQKPGHQGGEDRNRDPVVDSFHDDIIAARRPYRRPLKGPTAGQPRRLLCLIVAFPLLLAACQIEQVPEGQVLAVVNGEEITAAELNSEAGTRNLPIARDPALRQEILNELIERKLLVQEARRLRLDRTPQFLLASRRANELALAQSLLKEPGEDSGATEAQVASFIAAHPFIFGRRALLTVDRILADQVSPEMAARLARASSLEELDRLARGAQVAGQRATETWDTATLPETIRIQLQAVKPGSMFLVRHEGGIAAGKLLNVQAQPVPVEQQDQLARVMLAKQREEQALRSLTARLRQAAQIRVQPPKAEEPRRPSVFSGSRRGSPVRPADP